MSRARLAVAIALLASGALAGCTSPPSDGGLVGVVTVGPVCPVAREPPDPDCADRPLSVTLQALSGNRVVAAFTSDDDGHYNVTLPPGTYTIRDKAQSLPSCHAGPVAVAAHAYKTLDIQCDSGIR